MKDKLQGFAHRIQNDRSTLTFEVLADIHVMFPKTHKKLNHALEDIWSRKIKNVVVLGDLSSNGFMFQLEQCLKQLKEFPNRYLIALGNHDTYSMKEKQQLHIHPLYKELALHKHHHLYYDEMIAGYHFYVLNSEHPDKSNAYYSKQQLFWLKEHLEKDDVGKPVFVCCHHPLKNTHTHSDKKEYSMGFQTSDVLKILKVHPHVIFISAHIHNSYEICNVTCDNTLIEIDIPSFSSTEYGEKKGEVGYQIQVYHDFLYVKTRDYKGNEWIESHEFVIDFRKHHVYPMDATSIEH